MEIKRYYGFPSNTCSLLRKQTAEAFAITENLTTLEELRCSKASIACLLLSCHSPWSE